MLDVMKKFKFFQRIRPYWLDLGKFGEPITKDSFIVGVSPITMDAHDFTIMKRLIYWSEINHRHYYGPIVKEDSKYFNTLPEIINTITE